MPVNTAALKTFAPAMRRQLLEAVGRKLDLLLHQASADTLTTAAGPIEELRQQEADNRQELLERVAYSWFNRLAALRYLDARGWHPFGARVLMPQTESETQPELLKLLRSGSLPAELQPHTDEARLQGLLDGRLPTAQAGADPQGEVYRELILAVCRSYHQLLPTLFEGLDDASELLLPDDLLSDGSIAGGFRSQISDSDCEDVEIIGWLYQFYISEKKDQVIGKVVKSEDIPAATQLFTPNWIVKYMVQNSLGAQWLATYPASALKGQMEYYIEPAEQTDEVKAQLAAITPEALNPEELTLIDPACGSGHILVEAYELFKAIYLERGYQQREIPQLILEKNLFGLDIDERAAQLTSFALMMKGRADDRRLFERGVELNVMALVDSTGFDAVGLADAVNLPDYGLKLSDLSELKRLFEHATSFGSLIQVPEGLDTKLPILKKISEAKHQNLLASKALNQLDLLAKQATLLSAKYHVVAANPPYLGRKWMSPLLKKWYQGCWENCNSDLYAGFLHRSLDLLHPKGYASLVTMDSWMFAPAYQEFRLETLKLFSVPSLIHLGPGAFPSISGEVVSTQASLLRHLPGGQFKPLFIDCTEVKTSHEKEAKFQSGMDRHSRFKQSEFTLIEGGNLAYWLTAKALRLLVESPSLKVVGKPRSGLTTGDNPKYLRKWFEITGFNCSITEEEYPSGTYDKWVPLNGGSDFRRWYGSNEDVIYWENHGLAIKQNPAATMANREYQFRSGATWSKISSDQLGVRRTSPGFVFSAVGLKSFPPENMLSYVTAFLNSKVASKFIRVFAPNLTVLSGDVARLPFLVANKKQIDEVESRLVALTQQDWDSYERSWDFQSLPLLRCPTDTTLGLECSYTVWTRLNIQATSEMKRLEEENNRLFIDAYGLQDELTPDVPIEQITLTVNPSYRYSGKISKEELLSRFKRDSMAELLSYAVGCMMGRYSLDKPGLINANSGIEGFDPSKSTTFAADTDAIIPVLDGEWFEDDIVVRSRDFLRVAFPGTNLTDNLRFLEQSLGKDICKYFCTDFYKDHLQTYKKRPIYWLVQSPKKSFACLIYLHRYNKDTLNLVLNNYLQPYIKKLKARLPQLGLDQLNDDLPAKDRAAARKEGDKISNALRECQDWEREALLPLAQQRIELDLDDGVKVNYLKLQDVLAPIPGLAAKEE